MNKVKDVGEVNELIRNELISCQERHLARIENYLH